MESSGAELSEILNEAEHPTYYLAIATPAASDVDLAVLKSVGDLTPHSLHLGGEDVVI